MPFRENIAKIPESVLKTAKKRVPLAAELLTASLLLTSCEVVSSQQLYIVSVNLKEISNTPYADLGKGVQDFADQYHEQTGKSFVFGQPVVLGVSGETDFLATPLLTSEGKGSGYTIATYKDTSGQVQNRALIGLNGTVKDKNGKDVDYLSYYPLSEEKTSQLLAGQQINIDTSPQSPDLGTAFYGLTLKPGIKMANFQILLRNATTPAKAREILSNNLSTFFVTNPNTEKSFIAPINDSKILDQLVGLLTGVQPASALEPEITLTPLPSTQIPPTATKEPTATVTEAIDLKPNYEQTVSVEYMGVQINASLITDKSLDPVIKKVTVGENAYAEFVARSVYGVWAKNHLNQTFETYMRMIGEVQRDERNPLDIAIPVYANDTRDGVPYQNSDKSVNPAAQKKYLIIPWYQGEAPVSSDGTEVRSVAEINIALVNGKKVKNITLFEGNDYGDGMGINLDDTVLTFYGTAETIPNYPNKIRNTAAILSCMKWWMIKNSGRSTIGYPTAADESFIKLLVSGGLTLE